MHLVQEISRCLRHYYNDINETQIGFGHLSWANLVPSRLDSVENKMGDNLIKALANSLKKKKRLTLEKKIK